MNWTARLQINAILGFLLRPTMEFSVFLDRVEWSLDEHTRTRRTKKGKLALSNPIAKAIEREKTLSVISEFYSSNFVLFTMNEPHIYRTRLHDQS